ncbi:MAG: phosphoenolpyruvate--protein phosphotransferase [Verrucomicrobiales bacterium]|jgi:phosphotransferase system enzyme I (PtsI)|nr:phosphoenolpyruvate--protein phosphotransferase [Verrucomicrobiales bacterium]
MIVPKNTAEIRLQGIGVSPGIAIGPAQRIGKTLEEPEQCSITAELVEYEKERFARAVAATREQIIALQQGVQRGDADDSAAIFDVHLLLLEDTAVINEVLRHVEAKLNSIEWAYYSVVKRYIDSLRRISDPYLRERAVDIEDVAKRVLSNLSQSEFGDTVQSLPEPDAQVLLAHDLTPSDTVSLDRSRVIGFATEVGSPTSHTAIMARSMNIPAVVALHEIPDTFSSGDSVLIDGYHGLVILHATAETLSEYEQIIAREKAILSELERFKDQETRTADGKKLTLSANIEFIEELKGVKKWGAEGIGLYRTEFFYLTRKELQSEENQAANYRKAAEGTAPNAVIIRTVDIGGDKLCPELFETPEPNPFLGWRGIRLSLDQSEEFRIQLRAVLRASAHGKVRLMFPFISTLEELQGGKAELEKAKEELRILNVPFDENLEVGAMIEIPSAVMIADHLAKEVDFFSIGTNDLVQYTTAVDRVNDKVSHLYQPFHPAVIAMIRETVAAAHRNGIWCGICGEVASDIEMTPIWIGLGLDELSVGPAQLLRTRRAISKLNSAVCHEMTDQLRACGTSNAVRTHSLSLARLAYPELLM